MFLPDELWRRLHPIKAPLRWTLTYTDKLETKSEIGQRQAHERQKQVHLEKQRARQHEREREAQRLAEQRRHRARVVKTLAVTAGIVVAVAALVALLVHL